MSNPRCPWCHEEMSLNDNSILFPDYVPTAWWYECGPNLCNASAPVSYEGPEEALALALGVRKPKYGGIPMKLNDVAAKLTAAKEMGRAAFIEVTIPGQQATEFIVNANTSIENKLEYYRKTYDHNGVHKGCRDIKIVNAGDSVELMNRLFEQLRAAEQDAADANFKGE